MDYWAKHCYYGLVCDGSHMSGKWQLSQPDDWFALGLDAFAATRTIPSGTATGELR